jgi:hypothetical protein
MKKYGLSGLSGLPVYSVYSVCSVVPLRGKDSGFRLRKIQKKIYSVMPQSGRASGIETKQSIEDGLFSLFRLFRHCEE